MKIIHIVPSIASEASGPSYSVRRLCTSLIELGSEVELSTLDPAPVADPPSFLQTFPLGFGPRRLGRSPAMLNWLAGRCKSGGVSILHNHGMWQMNAIYPAWMAADYRVPLVFSPRNALSAYSLRSGSALKPIFWKLVQSKAIQKTTCFHATSEAEYQDIRAAGFKQPVAIIPNGIDVPVTRLKKCVTNTLVLTYLGRLHPEKGIENLFRAWNVVQDRFPKWRLRLIGPGDSRYVSKLKRLAVELGLNRIEFAGPVYGNDKWQAYADSNLYVLPSPSENFAMTVAEALSAAVPVIATKGTPWSGLVDNKAGWWIDIGVEPLIAAFEVALACSPNELEVMGNLGRGWMQREFSWVQIGRQMTDTYWWLVRGDSCPACVRLT